MNYDPKLYSYPSRRSAVYGTRGMVCATQPLAAQAGLDILKKGGNAMDAAVAAAACMTVLEPTSNGLGGDGFAIICTEGKLYGLNSSGPAPRLASVEAMRKKGYSAIPARGWDAVTVPGVTAGWAAIRRRFGRLSMEELLAPAVSYAEAGFPVTPVVSELWSRAEKIFPACRELTPAQRERWSRLFLIAGKDGTRHAPAPGEIFRSPLHAQTLRELARTDCESFYRGELAEKIDAASREEGGALRKEDLAAFEPEWVDPIHIGYRGHKVWELPPNGIGIVALMTLGILGDRAYPQGGHDDIEVIHRQLEALKLAFADANRYITDRREMAVTPAELLDPAYLASRRALIREEAVSPEAGDPCCGGTVYLCTADREGNMVSYIQSNYLGFGSGIVIPETGIALHDRGVSFSLDEQAANHLRPGRRPFHTIIPGFLTEGDGTPIGPFGVMGAYMQPQGHVQVIMNTLDFHMNPQQALDAPRWQWTGGKTVELEPGADGDLVRALRARGHDIKVAPDSLSFGRGQIIWRDKNGVLCGATEPRADGTVAVW